MFYTYLRGLVVLLLWSINGNAHYHNTDKIPNQDENYILVAPHRTWWILFIWPLRPSQNSSSLWQKKNSLPTVSLVGGFVCVAPFPSTVKIPAPQPSNILSTFSKK